MEKIGKERLMAIFIGLIMISSILGFAISNAIRSPTPQEVDIPSVVDRMLERGELLYVLRTGRIVIQDHYYSNCTRCLELNPILEAFTKMYGEYVVLEMVNLDTLEDNTTRQQKLQMIGMGGKIVELGNVSTQNEILDIFCELAIKQPRECLLMDY